MNRGMILDVLKNIPMQIISTNNAIDVHVYLDESLVSVADLDCIAKVYILNSFI